GWSAAAHARRASHPWPSAQALCLAARHCIADAPRHDIERLVRRPPHCPGAADNRRSTLAPSCQRSAAARVRPAAHALDQPSARTAPRRARAHLLGAQRMTDMDRDELLPALRSAIAAAPNAESAMTQAVRLLKDGVPDYTWVGIYLRDGEELVLGPFLGKPSPHTRIPLGKGICGAAATE